MNYRSDVDGLRAVAVLSVVAYHYGLPLPGGFTGVDVFFVISGFLITSHISAEIREGSFSLLGFYDRRIRRILPALIAMLAVTLLAGKFLLMPGDYMALGASAAAAAFGVSNFFFLANTGYFDQSSLSRAPCRWTETERNILLHYTKPTDRMILKIAADRPNVEAIIPSATLCDTATCKLALNGEFLYRDASHIRRNLSPATRRQLADLIGLTDTLRETPFGRTEATAASPN